MAKPIIHLLSISSSCRALLDCLRVRTYEDIIGLAQQAIGPAYRVTGRTDLMNPSGTERRGGRRDDAARGRDLQRVLADDRVRAVLTLRGGSWVTRILPDVDFDVLRMRRTPLHIFGFSELTTVVNIASRYPKVRAWYDHDLGHLHADPGGYREAYCTFLQDLVGIIDGGHGSRCLSGRLHQGHIDTRTSIRAVGGCLTVLRSLYGSRFEECINGRNRWLALEEACDDLHDVDRGLAHLKLAGAFERCAGLMLGRLHGEVWDGREQNMTAAVLELLKYHLPPKRRIPIITHVNFGHGHPAAPLLLNRPLQLTLTDGARGPRVLIRPRLRRKTVVA